MSPRVVLVGPPGAGKTTVAAILARRLGVAARDTDADVEAAQGVSVQDLFVTHGEERFRSLEADAVRTALAEHDGILSLGGGAVLDPGTRRALAGHPVVFLDVDLAHVTQRVGMGAGRPLLLGNVRATMRTLLQERRPAYEEVATIRVATDDPTPDQVADAVLERLTPPSRPKENP